eukprot:m.160480 g.160480  ORF g.160480 m.160480 type:complete len:223 (+) comp15168_c0_seq13:91-759(+)
MVICNSKPRKCYKLLRILSVSIGPVLGLEYQCEIPQDKMVPVHGTMSKIGCEECGAQADFETFCKDVKENIKDIYGIDNTAPQRSKNIFCKNCRAPALKPTTVLFGSSLPERFFTCKSTDLPDADLVMILGTSLVVGPANSIAYAISEECLRVVINREPVGQELGILYGDDATRDIFLQGDVDAVCLDLIIRLGWLDELLQMKDSLPEASKDLLEATIQTIS